MPSPSQPSHWPQFLDFLALVNGHQMTFKEGGTGWRAGLLCLSLADTLGGHSLLWCHGVFTGLLGACKTPSADNHKCPQAAGRLEDVLSPLHSSLSPQILPSKVLSFSVETHVFNPSTRTLRQNCKLWPSQMKLNVVGRCWPNCVF